MSEITRNMPITAASLRTMPRLELRKLARMADQQGWTGDLVPLLEQELDRRRSGATVAPDRRDEDFLRRTLSRSSNRSEGPASAAAQPTKSTSPPNAPEPYRPIGNSLSTIRVTSC